MIQYRREFVSRFAVVKDDQIASSIWRVWKGRNNDNIYIAPKNIAGSLKVSLHESCHCHVAATAQHWRKSSQAGHPRPVMTNWFRPETPNQQIVIVASLLIAPEFLSPWGNASDHRVHWLTAPELGKAHYINLIFSRISPAKLRKDKLEILDQVQLTTGEYFAIIRSLISFDIEEFFQNVNLTFPMDQTIFLTDVGGPGLRALLFSDPNETGVLQLTDMGGTALRRINGPRPE